ncbi:hypothetical protein [Selenihalanaerobacter shriftii]|uniref:SnoaL-like domain-containing protein n=1 Tax=Selenihalanaerobacter shriftii TaxID=142842 RepID=A0A1T4Q8Y8_9FIRM|nr:hypothetical protein [Selenihalanaerobacter shriftii]SKA00155.1 hypothetical protein SAMN02745118_02477 [Selenihalanaerobacter shriftii]
MSNRKTEDRIRDIIQKWFAAWISQDKEKIKYFITPNVFNDKEKVYKDEELIYEEDKDYTRDEYLQHVEDLWTQRKYLEMEIKPLEVSILDEISTYSGSLNIKLEQREDNSIVTYNTQVSIELSMINGKLYIVNLKNIIEIDP